MDGTEYAFYLSTPTPNSLSEAYEECSGALLARIAETVQEEAPEKESILSCKIVRGDAFECTCTQGIVQKNTDFTTPTNCVETPTTTLKSLYTEARAAYNHTQQANDEHQRTQWKYERATQCFTTTDFNNTQTLCFDNTQRLTSIHTNTTDYQNSTGGWDSREEPRYRAVSTHVVDTTITYVEPTQP